MLKISLLNALNLKPNYIYETIVSTYTTEDKLPNPAPMGVVLLDEQKLVISPFLSTQTFKNIEKYKCAVINFIYDLKIFYESTFSTKKPKLSSDLFEKAAKVDAPRLKSAIAYIEVQFQEIQKDANRSRITGEIVAWDLSTIPFVPLNRGYNLVLESLIHATRILAFQNDAQKVKTLEDLINQYQKLIEKVAPSGEFVEIMEQIHKIIEKK